MAIRGIKSPSAAISRHQMPSDALTATLVPCQSSLRLPSFACPLKASPGLVTSNASSTLHLRCPWVLSVYAWSIRCNQMQSDAIRCNQTQSVYAWSILKAAIKCKQAQSTAVQSGIINCLDHLEGGRGLVHRYESRPKRRVPDEGGNQTSSE